MLKKIKIIILSVLLLGTLWLVWSLFSHRMPWQHHTTTQHQLTILTYNTQGMAISKKYAEKMAMLKHINRMDADVICLQEVLVYKDTKKLTLSKLREAMSNYPYTYYDFKLYNGARQFGNVVFSRYPLINKQTIHFESRSNISSQCDIVVKKDTIRLIVNHLESFRIEKQDLSIELSDAQHLKDCSLVRKLIDSSSLRRDQVRTVRRTIHHSPYPVIAVGDFNALPISFVYWTMNCGMRDVFAESSFGRYGSTHHVSGIGIRIDYIFTSRSLYPLSARVDHSAKYSDHDPLISTIGW